MTQANLAALVCYRLEQADEAVRDARLLLSRGSLRASSNRSYYAMFKHSGVISLFNRLYVKSGRFPKDFSKWLRRAFDLRTRCGYASMVTVSPDETAELIAHAEQFVDRVRAEMEPLSGEG